jgi:predicted restriction endonuclease
MGLRRSTNIALPFYPLSSDELWRVTAADGSGVSPEDARSLRHLQNVGAFAQIDAELSESLGSTNFRKIAIDTLLATYFDTDATDLLRGILCH